MFDRWFSRLYDRISENRKIALYLLIFLVGASGAGMMFVKFNSNIKLMIPHHPTIVRNIEFFRSSNMANKVLISIGLNDPTMDKDDLIKVVDSLVSSMSPEFFTKITSGVSDEAIDEMMEGQLQDLAESFSPQDMATVDSRISDEYVSLALAESYRRMLGPGGIIHSSMTRGDPLGLKLIMLKKLQTLSTSIGHDVKVDKGKFFSHDSQNIMIIADAAVAVTDIRGSEKLYNHLNQILDGLPDYVTSSVIAGHFHTFSNENVIKRDIRLTVAIASIGFLVLIFVIIGDHRALLIYIIPLAAVVIATNISYFILGELSYSVIGLAAVIAGISIDYGIHVFIAAKMTGDPAKGVKLVAKPLVIGALTTVGVFFAFFFSQIDGYHQLAVLSIISVLLALLISMLILPQFITPGQGKLGLIGRQGEEPVDYNFSNGATTFLWLGCTLILLYFALGVKLENNILRVDGTEKKIIDSEDRFKDLWGTRKRAILVVQEDDLQTALEVNDKIYAEAVEAIGAPNVSSLAPLWPSKKRRLENLARWNEFWRGGKEEKLREILAREGEKHKFSKSAFDPFFQSLTASYDRLEVAAKENDESIKEIYGRFVSKMEGGGYQVLTFAPDLEIHVGPLDEISQRHPSSFLVSGAIMEKLFSGAFLADVSVLTKVAVFLVVALTFLFMGNMKETLVALAPVATSAIWILGTLTMFGHSMNVANMVAYIVVMGLCVDYGIFMTYKSRSGQKTGTVLAVTFSAISTLLGAGVLVFASHPALFSTGSTMLIGVGAGHLSSIFAVPYLYDLLMGKTSHREMAP